MPLTVAVDLSEAEVRGRLETLAQHGAIIGEIGSTEATPLLLTASFEMARIGFLYI